MSALCVHSILPYTYECTVCLVCTVCPLCPQIHIRVHCVSCLHCVSTLSFHTHSSALCVLSALCVHSVLKYTYECTVCPLCPQIHIRMTRCVSAQSVSAFTVPLTLRIFRTQTKSTPNYVTHITLILHIVVCM